MYLVHDLLVVVVADGTAQLVVVHVWLTFPDPPEHRYRLGIEELKLSVVADPGNDVGVLLILKELVEKLPELDLSCRGDVM